MAWTDTDLLSFLSPAYAEAASPGPPVPDDDALLRMLKPMAPAQPAPAPLPPVSAPPSAPPPQPVPVAVPRPVPGRRPPPLPGALVEGNLLDERSAIASQGAAVPGTLGQAIRETPEVMIRTAQEAAPFVAPAILSPLGAAAGGAVAGPLGGIAGEALGSYAARWLNVKLGLEEPGTTGDVLSVATPPLMRGALAAGKSLVRHLPGASRISHELAQESLEQLPARLTPPMASDALFRQAAQHNPTIVTDRLRDVATEVLTHEQGLAPAYRQQRLIRAAHDLLEVIDQYQGQVPLHRLDAYRQRLGLMIGQASEENWPHVGGLRRLYGALNRDLDTAVQQGVAGAESLRNAIHAARQEYGLDTLQHLWSPGRGITTLEGNLTQVNGKQILNNFDKLVAEDRLFAEAFTPDQLTNIRETLQDVARMTTRPANSMGSLARALPWVGRGAGIGIAAGGDIPSALVTSVALEAAPPLIAAALQTSVGRAAVRRALQEGGGQLTPVGIALISQAVRGEGLAHTTELPRPVETIAIPLPGQGGR